MNRNEAPHGQLPYSQIVPSTWNNTIDFYIVALPGACLLGAILAVVLSWF